MTDAANASPSNALVGARLAFIGAVEHDRAGVVELVGDRDEQDGAVVFGAQVGEVVLLALSPRGFGVFEGVAQATDYALDLLAEDPADLLERLFASLVLGGVVEQGGYRFVFSAALVDHQ